MSDFPTALDGALRRWYPTAGVKRPATHRQGLAARISALEKAAGGRGAAASATGIAASTWRSWFASKRRTPSPASLRKVEDAYQQLLRDKSTRRTALPALMTITAVVVGDPRKSRYINRKAHRAFKCDQLDREGLRPIVLSWQKGRTPQEVAAVAIAAVKAAYGQEFAFEGDNVTVELS